MVSSKSAGSQILSEDAVRQLLSVMLRASRNDIPEVFWGLYLLRDHRTNLDLPSIPQNSSYEIFDILINVIRHNLQKIRRLFDIVSDETLFAHRRDYLRAISLDVASGSNELICWSLLYHCYVRVDLAISLQDFATASGFTMRSNRRYRDRAIHVLWIELVRLETLARRNNRLDRLQEHLYRDGPHFIGRQQEIKTLSTWILEADAPKIIVTGLAGIGKSALVSFFLKRLLNEVNVFDPDILLWLDHVEGLQNIFESLSYQLPPSFRLVDDFKKLQLIFKIVLIIDEIANLSVHLHEQIFEAFPHATIIIINDSHDGLDKKLFSNYLVVRALPRSESLLLAQRILRSLISPDDHILINTASIQIYQRVGGNPRLIEQGCLNWIAGWGLSGFDLVQSESVLDNATIAALLLIPDKPLNRDRLYDILLHFLSVQQLDYLVDHHYITIVNGIRLIIPTAVRTYLQECWEGDKQPVLRRAVDQMLPDLAIFLKQFPGEALSIMLHVLSSLRWDIHQLFDLWWMPLQIDCEYLASHISWRELVLQFRQCCGESLPAKVEIFLAASVRVSGFVHESRQQLTEIIYRLKVEKQSRLLVGLAHLQRAICLRILGRFHQAALDLYYAKYCSIVGSDDRLHHLVYLEMARNALDQRDGVLAYRYIREVTKDGFVRDPDIDILYAELENLAGKSAACLSRCQQLLSQIQDLDMKQVGRIYGVMGTAYLALEKKPACFQCYEAAIRILDQEMDWIASCRVKLNLAMALSRDDQPQRVRDLVLEIRGLQKKVGDALGLVYLEANLVALLSEEFDSRSFGGISAEQG